jgi:transposase
MSDSLHKLLKRATRDNLAISKVFDALENQGVFVLLSSTQMKIEDVLPEYYLRQAVEQFFDYAKNYAKMMPVRNHKVETIAGHMMMSFIATFLCVLIKNRMNMMDSSYCTVPDYFRDKISDDEKTISIQTEKGKQHLVMIQDPLKEIFESSPGALFSELELVGGVYYP